MSLHADVETLAAMERGSAGPGERASARWCAERLTAAGAQSVQIESFRYQHTFGHVHALHFALAALGRVPAGLALASFELDFSGRAQPVRGLMPAGEGANVVGRLPATGERRATVVLAAHHDAAHTGLMWHPRLASPAWRSGVVPFSLVPELAMGLLAAGPRRLRGVARFMLGFLVALSLDVARGSVVPGASDNASGVAAVLALVERFAKQRPEGLEVLAILPGAEESGMGGMAAWLRDHGGALDPATTLVLGLDTLGGGEPMVATAEGPTWAVRYREEDLSLADAGARRAGVAAPRRFRVGGWTDPVLAALAGFRSLSILSLRGNAFNDYHLPSDIPEKVDWASVEACTDMADGIVREFAQGRER